MCFGNAGIVMEKNRDSFLTTMGLSPTFTFVYRVQNPPFSEEGGKNHSESEPSKIMCNTLWGKLCDSQFTQKYPQILCVVKNWKFQDFHSS